MRPYGTEEYVRPRQLKSGHIDTVTSLPANLFHSTGTPVCILALKKCSEPDDELFINAAEYFVKGKHNLNISRYISTAVDRVQIDLQSAQVEFAGIDKTMAAVKHQHSEFLKKVNLTLWPGNRLSNLRDGRGRGRGRGKKLRLLVTLATAWVCQLAVPLPA